MPWKYFVLFASLDTDAIDSKANSEVGVLHPFRSAIDAKECRGQQLRLFFQTLHHDFPTLMSRILLLFMPKVKPTEATDALFCTCHNFDSHHAGAIAHKATATAGFSFAAGDVRYVTTCLHGHMNKCRQPNSILPSGVVREWGVFLGDAFAVDEKEPANAGELGPVVSKASEVGPLVCDWRNHYLDVALVLLDQPSPATAWYTEAEVVKYMQTEMACSVSSEPVRVYVHSAPFFRTSAEPTNGIPGTIVEVGSWFGNPHHWLFHFVVQLDQGHAGKQGQSGSAVTLARNGRPLGTMVATLSDSRVLVTPLHHIYSSLNSVLGRQTPKRQLQLCVFDSGPVAVMAARHSTKFVLDGEVCCNNATPAVHKMQLLYVADQLRVCCVARELQVASQIEQREHDPLSNIQPLPHTDNNLPHCCVSVLPNNVSMSRAQVIHGPPAARSFTNDVNAHVSTSTEPGPSFLEQLISSVGTVLRRVQQ